MRREVLIGNKTVGDNSPCFIIAEIGINHNGSLDLAKKMIDEAVFADVMLLNFKKEQLLKSTHPKNLMFTGQIIMEIPIEI